MKKAGLYNKYLTVVKFRERVLSLSSLAYLPVEEIPKTSDLMKEEFEVDEWVIWNYFEIYYVGKIIPSSSTGIQRETLTFD